MLRHSLITASRRRRAPRTGAPPAAGEAAARTSTPTPILAAVVVLGASLALAGCGPPPWNNPYPVDEAAEDVLYLGFTSRPKHLDPALSYSNDESRFIAQVYEPPLQYHYLKRPYTLEPLTATAVPEPRLYDSAGAPLPADAPAAAVARSVYEIRIREGIRYQPHPAFARNPDGAPAYAPVPPTLLPGIQRLADFPRTATRELVAADYVYQIKRLASPRVPSPIASLMRRHIAGLDALAGRLEEAAAELDDGAWLDLRAYALPGAEVVDRYTFRIVLDDHYPQLRYWLAMSFFAPLPWEADRFYSQEALQARNITLDWYPVGTGPFMLTENNPNRRMVLERNPNFRGEPYPRTGEPGDRAAGLLADAGRTMPFVRKAVYSLEPETIPYWNKFLQGYYDASVVASDSFDAAIAFGPQGDPDVTPELAAKNIRLATAVDTAIYYIAFNMLDPVVGGYGEAERKLRRAIGIAVDFRELVSIFFNGRGQVAHSPIPPGIFGHTSGRAGMNPWLYRWQDGAARLRPLAEGRELLAQAGYPGGRDADTGAPLVLHFDAYVTGPDSRARLEWLRKQLAKLDVQLDVRATDYNRFRDKVDQGSWQMFLWGWGADYPDPENFLFLLYGPNAKVPHGGENAANYENPEFDRLFRRMKALPDGPERRALVTRMVDIARRDGPWLWGFFPEAYTLHHAWYRNYKPNLMAANTLKYLRVDAAARAAARARWNDPVVWPLAALAAALAAVAVPAVLLHRRRLRETAR